MSVEVDSPYARALRLTRAHDGARIVLTMPFGDHLLGRPGFLHGGSIAGLMENAAWVTLRDALGDEPATFKPIGITVDFLRGGKMSDSYASAHMVRLGRRMAVVTTTAWQESEADPIAQADLKFLIARNGAV